MNAYFFCQISILVLSYVVVCVIIYKNQANKIMRLSITHTKNNTYFYMIKSYRENGKNKTKIIERLGELAEIKQKANGEDPIIWAKNYIEQRNQEEKENKAIYFEKLIEGVPLDETQKTFNIGYLFLQISEIIKINKRRWEIEESFRILKTDFKARPVYLKRDDRIKAHFTTCFLSLLIYRILEKKLNEEYTTQKIITTLRDMNSIKIDGLGYKQIYAKSHITTELNEKFNINIDQSFISLQNMKKILKETKK